MAMKEFLQKLQPFQLYTILVLSCLYFLVQMGLCYTTHSITLLVASYHMLCNIITLGGCLITIKHSDKDGRSRLLEQNKNSSSTESTSDNFIEINLDRPHEQQKQIVNKHLSRKQQQQQHERSLKNTFGWTRIDILTMLIVCIFLAALCFSALVEAIQTLIHIGHQDTMHMPGIVLLLGILGLVLNGLCYLLIGGYTYHHGSFLHVTEQGNVVLDRIVSTTGIQKGPRRLSGNTIQEAIDCTLNENKRASIEVRKRQNSREMIRDVSSSIFVIICSVIVLLLKVDGNPDNEITRPVDPIISIISCIVLFTLSYSFMKESGLILLQTIPDTIDIDIFTQNMMVAFKDQIVSIHDLHIWQLSHSKYVSTVHIIFQDPTVYSSTMNEIINFFHEQGISIVTIQPEFNTTSDSVCAGENNKCLVTCRQKECKPKHCCTTINETPGLALEQVVSMKNIEGLASEMGSTGSFKSLNETTTPRVKKISTASLNLPSALKRLKQPTESHRSTENNQQTDKVTEDMGEKKYGSESIITGADKLSVDNKKRIVLENKLQEQVDHTDNNETENLYNRSYDQGK